MWDILRIIFCCHRRNIKDTNYNKNYNSISANKCDCDTKGPPAWGTCDVCGAWTTY